MTPPIAIDFRDRQFWRNVERLCRLGPRPIGELLIELGGRRLIRTEIEVLVARYAGIDPKILATLGADRLPP